jgi:hypothetical protein
MKYIYRLSFLAAFLILFTACEDDESLVVQDQESVFTANNGDASNLVLNFSYPENPAMTVTFSGDVQAPYNVVVSADTEFSSSVSLGTTESNSFTVNVAGLNTVLLELGASPFKDFTFYVRGESASGTTEPLTYNAITYVEADPELNAPVEGSSIILDNTTLEDTAATIAFNDFDTDGATVSVNYSLQATLSGTEFTAPQEVIVNSDNEDFSSSFTLTHQSLNTIANLSGIESGETGDLDFRVVATITTETGVLERTSNIQTVSVTTYVPLNGPRLAVPGPHQDGGDSSFGQWNPDENENVAFVPYLEASATGETDYEGFVYLTTEYKFVSPDADGNFAWGNVDYGDASGSLSYTQQLTADGEGNCATPDGEGYYLVNANTTDLTYSAQKTDWGIIGFATTGDDSGWSQDMDLTFDRASRTWSITLDLSVGEFKFRANDDWGTNFGLASDGTLEFNSSTNMMVSEAGTYEVILDLSNPRNYQFSLNLL